jgi:hypothetical protein
MNTVCKMLGINLHHDTTKVFPIYDDDTSINEFPIINIHRIKLFDNDAIYSKVIYDNYEEFQYLCNAFKKDIPIIVNNSTLGSIDSSNNIDKVFDRKPYYYFEHYIETALNNLTKYKNRNWSKHMTYILVNMIRGVNVTLDASCSFNKTDFEFDEEMGYGNTEYTHSFIAHPNVIMSKNKMYNDIIINIILNVIIDTDTNKTCDGGEINKIALFTCIRCYNYPEYVIDNLCNACYECKKYN